MILVDLKCSERPETNFLSTVLVVNFLVAIIFAVTIEPFMIFSTFVTVPKLQLFSPEFITRKWRRAGCTDGIEGSIPDRHQRNYKFFHIKLRN